MIFSSTHHTFVGLSEKGVLAVPFHSALFAAVI
jgi:hypothetical protein